MNGGFGNLVFLNARERQLFSTVGSNLSLWSRVSFPFSFRLEPSQLPALGTSELNFIRAVYPLAARCRPGPLPAVKVARLRRHFFFFI